MLNLSFSSLTNGRYVVAIAFPKPRRILLLVNPNGGVGKAKRISDTVVKPMLQHSGLTVKEQCKRAVLFSFNSKLGTLERDMLGTELDLNLAFYCSILDLCNRYRVRSTCGRYRSQGESGRGRLVGSCLWRWSPA